MDSIANINGYSMLPQMQPTSKVEKNEEKKQVDLESDKNAEKDKKLKVDDASNRSLIQNEVLLGVGTQMLKEAMNVEGNAVLSLLQSMGLGANVDIKA
ncbi:MAG: hypothetical protein QMD92_07610 [bacterium]|nr:hypothetical protein [bacterium]